MNEVAVNQRLRELCQQILQEKDPVRSEELIDALKSLVRAAQEEARVRMSYLARHYRARLGDVVSPQRSERLNRGGRTGALLNFLGLGAGMRLGSETEG